ncbi:MAG: 16S rRNA (guanine(966)-N(2))-methyltransferase RsmD [bacterium]|nr:16S rRNA (guanine(966)-N(2))-methyltransferase RsmD [bacterium]
MSLRIIAGLAKGRALHIPDGVDVRPSTARVREAVFNSLQSFGHLQDAQVLDLFAGSGALGLEALSRGAASVVFVESHHRALETLRANIALVGYEQRSSVIAGDAMTEVLKLQSAGLASWFDIALCDPPYGFGEWSLLLAQLPAQVVVAESNTSVEVGTDWSILKSGRYAGTVVVIAERR